MFTYRNVISRIARTEHKQHEFDEKFFKFPYSLPWFLIEKLHEGTVDFDDGEVNKS